MIYIYDPQQRNQLHLYENTIDRRIRLGGYVHGQARCGTGNGHQRTTSIRSMVTCNNCKQLMNKG